ncbi:KTSC domain-containing protein [uncultured Clostridium sp.]|uniref:KTSC domain-containing protein n=1 Tax=uncultured Clostridium sp. TaxID=59620 RepID=UPI00262F1F01|nr:KTSC domain-containing protein [uncultured Clostridium sp.]
MNMISVNSSNLVAIGYDGSSMTLRVQFRTSIYDYFNVPSNVYDNLLNANSHGQYHAAYIKNSYQFKRVG